MPWSIADYRVFYLNGKAFSKPQPLDASSIAVSLPPVPGNQIWRVETIAVACENPISGVIPEVLGYDNPPPVGVVPCCGTRQGTLDFADGSPISILEGNQFTLVFSVVDQAVIPLARVQVVIMNGTPGQPAPLAA